jgi:phage FluMu protein Com
VLVADIVDEAFGQSALESHDHGVKCPKCASINVYRIDTIRRRIPMVVT